MHGEIGCGSLTFRTHGLPQWRRGRRQAGSTYYQATRARGSAYDRQARYIAREDREDLVYERSRNLPAWAAGNPHTYFRAAERYERVNGVGI